MGRTESGELKEEPGTKARIRGRTGKFVDISRTKTLGKKSRQILV